MPTKANPETIQQGPAGHGLGKMWGARRGTDLLFFVGLFASRIVSFISFIPQL